MSDDLVEPYHATHLCNAIDSTETADLYGGNPAAGIYMNNYYCGKDSYLTLFAEADHVFDVCVDLPGVFEKCPAGSEGSRQAIAAEYKNALAWLVKDITGDYVADSSEIYPSNTIEQRGRIQIKAMADYIGRGVRAYLHNKYDGRGGTITPPMFYDIYLSKDKKIDAQDWEIQKNLQVNNASSRSYQYLLGRYTSSTSNIWQLPKEVTLGEYFVLVHFDSTNIYPENDEANNVAVLPLNVVEHVGDDFYFHQYKGARPELLTLKSSTYQNYDVNNRHAAGLPYASTISAIAGSKLYVGFDAAYEGNTSDRLADFHLTNSFYLSEDTQLDTGDQPLSVIDVYNNKQSFEEGGDIERMGYHIHIPESTATKEYYLLVVLDDPNDYAEKNESNNVAAIKIKVVQQSVGDYEAGKVSVSYNSLSAVPLPAGEAFGTVRVSVPYHGDKTAKEILSLYQYVTPVVKFYLSKDETIDENDIFIGEDDSMHYSEAIGEYVGYLSQGKYSSNPKPNKIPADTPAGDYYLIAHIDANNDYTEDNESNNISMLAVQVSSITGDFRIGHNASIGPVTESKDNAAFPGGEIDLNAYLEYTGLESESHLSNPRPKLGYYLSVDTALDESDILLGQSEAIKATRFKYGMTSHYKALSSFTVPEDTPLGTYYVIFRADDENAYIEPDENNNVSVLTSRRHDMIHVVPKDNHNLSYRGDERSYIRSKTEYGYGDEMLTYKIGSWFMFMTFYEYQGAGFKKNINVTYYLSKDKTFDATDKVITTTKLTSSETSTIANSYTHVGNSYSLLSSGLEGGSPGKYYVLSILDSENQLPEYDEDNNIKAFALEIVE